MWAYSHSNYLQHHGILGMKWGVRRTPEQLGRRSSKSIRQERRGRVGGPEAILATCAFMTLSTVATVVARNRAKDRTAQILKTIDKGKVSSWGDLSAIKGSHSMTSDLTKTNPRFHEGLPYKINCTNCVVALEMRRRGYDVEAAPTTTPRQKGSSYEMYKNYKDVTVAGDKTNDVLEAASSWGDGARGVVEIFFSLDPPIGHILSLEVDRGVAKFIDPQTGKVDPMASFEKLEQITFGRIDNLEFKDTALETVKRRR